MEERKHIVHIEHLGQCKTLKGAADAHLLRYPSTTCCQDCQNHTLRLDAETLRSDVSE